MTFPNYTYTRPDLQLMSREFSTYLKEFEQATTVEQQNNYIEHINRLRNDFATAENLAYIRSSINIYDTFYEAERAFFDEASPQFQQLESNFYSALVQSKFRPQLEDRWGKQLFQLATNRLRCFSEAIIPLLQQENKLATEYAKLIASAQIQYNGNTYTLAQLVPFQQSTNRLVRKEATEAYFEFFNAHKQQLGTIYDQLVHLRHAIAIELGFNNFVELGYVRMDRIGYDAISVQKFRQQIAEKIVPLTTHLYEKQTARIGVETLYYYDESLQFLTGNASPKGDTTWILNNGKKMYEHLSSETSEFIHFMMDNELFDVDARKGKEPGGYCTFIENDKSPFIFSNFNGTSDDIDVLTHEAGHAFQVYQSRNFKLPEYVWPTTEAAEIHSMSMEFFTWPSMELFFEEDAEKYRYSHLIDALLFLPYGVAVDEFQEVIYLNPTLTPEQRNAEWKKIESKYLPIRNYDGLCYLENGGLWQQQLHIYEVPFYYIDYTFAQVCALQFWVQSINNFEQAWEDYLHLCSLGGSKPFLQLVNEANLISPFDEHCIDSLIKQIEQYIESVNDVIL